MHNLQIFESINQHSSIIQNMIYNKTSHHNFTSLSDYLKYVINHISTNIDEKNKKHYLIQSKITNNQQKEINLEFILKEELFSGDFVYSFVCINRNQRILIDQLKNNNQVRQLMVGQISHDLRTPLNGIIINLNLVMR